MPYIVFLWFICWDEWWAGPTPGLAPFGLVSSTCACRVPIFRFGYTFPNNHLTQTALDRRRGACVTKEFLVITERHKCFHSSASRRLESTPQHFKHLKICSQSRLLMSSGLAVVCAWRLDVFWRSGLQDEDEFSFKLILQHGNRKFGAEQCTY